MSSSVLYGYRAFFRLIRLPNLLIVAGTQYLLFYGLILPALRNNGISPILSGISFDLFVLTTVIITASGYIINDIVDDAVDLINRPRRIIIGKVWSKQKVWKLYWSLNMLGFVIAIYLADYVEQLLLALIYPMAVAVLYIYSTHLKKQVLWGNLLVSLFCAGVAGILLFAERVAITTLAGRDEDAWRALTGIIIWYMVFAFFSTLYREIIKDIEDVKGDKEGQGQTLPIIHGIRTAKWGALSAGGILFLFMCWMMLSEQLLFTFWSLLGGTFFVIIPLLYSFYQLKRAQTKQEFHRLSTMVKFIMLGGLLLLLLLIEVV